MAHLSFISARLKLVTGLFCIAALLVGLTGCAKIKTRPVPVVIDGFWHTPDRKVEFKRTNEGETSKRFSITDGAPDQPYLIADYKKQGVVFDPFKLHGAMFLFGGSSDQIVTIQTDRAFYKILKLGESTWSPRMNLPLSAEKKFKCIAHGKPCLMNFGVPAVGRILKGHPLLYGDQIRYHIPYSTDGQDFLIDITLELVKDRYIDWSDWHFPGSP